MKQKLITALEGMGFVSGETLFLQGTLGADEAYPQSFVTFWVQTSTEDAHYNNEALSVVWEVVVNYYSDRAEQVNAVPAQIRATLKAAGFIPQGRGYDLPSDEPTHTGWTQTYLFKDYE